MSDDTLHLSKNRYGLWQVTGARGVHLTLVDDDQFSVTDAEREAVYHVDLPNVFALLKAAGLPPYDEVTAAKLAYAEARVRYWLTEPPAQSEEQRRSMSSDLLYTENAMLALARKERET